MYEIMTNQTEKIIFLRKLAQCLCAAAVVIGILTLAGWWLGITLLPEFFSEGVLMNPLTAFCFILSSVALILLSRKKLNFLAQQAGGALAVIVLGFALVKMGDHVLGWHSGVDTWMFNDQTVKAMSLKTAVSFFLLGCALMIMKSPFRGKVHPAEILLGIVILTAFFTVMEYVYSISSLPKSGFSHLSMTGTSTLVFVLLSFAAFCFSHRYWFTKLISGDGIGSKLARRFLPLVPLPLLLSLLRIQGQQMGLYSVEFGIAFFTLIAMILFAGMILFNAELFNHIDAKHQQAVDETRQSEARLKLALKGSKIGVWDWDVASHRLVWDEQMFSIYAVDKKSFTFAFQDWERTVIPEDIEPAKGQIEQALKGEKDFDTEFRIRWPNGSVHYIKAMALVIRDAKGHPLRMIGMNWDTTDMHMAAERAVEAKKQEEEAKMFLDSIIENIPNMIFVKDARELRFVRFNKAGEELLGIPSAQMLGKNDYDFFPRDQADFFIEKDRETLRKKETFDIPEESIDTAKGKKILHTKKVTILDTNGQPKYLLGISEDVTEMKKAEKKLKETLNDLERSNRELEQFAYVASHDLQEPLRTVASFCQLLEKRYKDTLDDQAKGYINYAVDGAKRMQVMIDDLLNYARTGKKDAQKSALDLNKMLERILFDLDPMIRTAKASVRVASLPIVVANPTQMTQLFQNLLTNALKFTGDKDPVIEVSARRQMNSWEFMVRDNGIGIKEEYYDQIFVIFQRLHSRQSYSGTGIGLALCKKIVENYGGRIWVESKPQEGTSFYFTLPA